MPQSPDINTDITDNTTELHPGDNRQSTVLPEWGSVALDFGLLRP